MDLASDTSYLDEQSVSSGQITPERRRESGASEGSSMDIDNSQMDMDMTMNTNVSGRLSMARPRRSSTRPRRESTAPRETDANTSLTEFTVGLGVSLVPEKEPSAQWLALKAAVSNHTEEPKSPPADIDIESAAARLLLAGRDIQVPSNEEEEADMTLSSEGGDSATSGDGKTMDFTALTGGLRRASMRDATTAFPAASQEDTTSFPRKSLNLATPSVKEPIKEQALPLASASKPSSIPVPTPSGPSIFRAKATSFAPTPRAASSSPTKPAESSPIKSTQRPKPPSFSAAFAPRSPAAKPKATAFSITVPSSLAPKSPARQTPAKRSHPVDENSAAAESPAKKLIVAGEGGAKTQAIPKPTPNKVAPSPSPAKKAFSVVRRPSDFLTKPNMSRVSLPFRQAPPPAASVSASPERQSVTPASVTPVKAQTQPPKSPRFAQPSPKVLTPVVECERETSLQQEAELRIASSPRRNSSPLKTPTRRSFAPMVASPWLSRSNRPSHAPSMGEDGNEDGDEFEDDVDVLDYLSEEARARLPGSVDELLRLAGAEFMDNMVVRRRSTMALRAREEYPDAPSKYFANASIGTTLINFIVIPADYAIAMAVDFPKLAYHEFVGLFSLRFTDSC